MRRVCDGSEAAFKLLISPVTARAHAVAFSIIRDRSLAEDAVQDALADIWRSRRSFRPELSSPRAWILTVVRRRAVDRVRREEAQRSTLRKAAQLHALWGEIDPTSVDDDVLRWESYRQVERLLGCLPPEQLDVIRRMYFIGQTGQDIARQTGVPLGTVKSRVRLAMRRLRRELQPDIAFRPSNPTAGVRRTSC
jgi:RNA polymerase sigma-70 factor (ECF subfamily)